MGGGSVKARHLLVVGIAFLAVGFGLEQGWVMGAKVAAGGFLVAAFLIGIADN
jgi:hypothetical protein